MHVSNVLRQQHGASTELDIDLQDKNYDFGVDISLRLGRSEMQIYKKEEKVDKISDEKEEGLEKKRSALDLGFQIQSDETSKLDNICRHLKNANGENKCASSRKDAKKCASSRKDVKTARSEDQQETLEEHEQTGLKKTRVCVKASCEDPSVRTKPYIIHYVFI